jgi:DNA invertase Pin-like site-specific DNA recombinase
MLIGYCRVSKSDGSQSVALQRDALIAAGVDSRFIYEDEISGSIDHRPGLDSCLMSLREGDTLVIWKLDRLGRSLRHLLELVEDLSSRGIGLKVLTGVPIDTSNASGRLVFSIFAGLAEYERELIRERTLAGLASARARGRMGGRKPVMTPEKIRIAQAMLPKEDTVVTHLAKELGVTTTTLYRYVSADGTVRPIGEAMLAGRSSPRCKHDRTVKVKK